MSALFCCNGSNSTAYGISTAVKSSTPCIACRTASCKPTRITTTCAVGIRTTGKPIRRSTKPASIAAARSSRGSKARDRRGSGAGHRAARPAAGSAPAAVLLRQRAQTRPGAGQATVSTLPASGGTRRRCWAIHLLHPQQKHRRLLSGAGLPAHRAPGCRAVRPRAGGYSPGLPLPLKTRA